MPIGKWCLLILLFVLLAFGIFGLVMSIRQATSEDTCMANGGTVHKAGGKWWCEINGCVPNKDIFR